MRQIDPSNPNLTYFSNPGSAPSQAALDRLDAAVEAAAIKRVADKVMPDGVPIGDPGNNPKIRELSGGLEAAQDLFDYLRVGGVVYRSDSKATVIQLPGDAGYITFRRTSRSVGPAVDINVPVIPIKRVHFH